VADGSLFEFINSPYARAKGETLSTMPMVEGKNYGKYFSGSGRGKCGCKVDPPGEVVAEKRRKRC